MIWIIASAGLLIFLLGWLLITPNHLVVNTNKDLYELKLLRVFRLGIHPRQGFWYWSAPFYSSQKDLKSLLSGDKEGVAQSKLSKGKSDKSGGIKIRKTFRLLKGIMQSLKVKHLYLNVDSGDYCLNAQVTPIALLLSGHRRWITTNFSGVQQLELLIETRLAYLIKPLWVYLITK